LEKLEPKMVSLEKEKLLELQAKSFLAFHLERDSFFEASSFLLEGIGRGNRRLERKGS
jgi:hypothetical protein